ncbi:DEAD/DEAH box helicase [Nocardioides sp. J2M5]|uniref:DEAD/DEAH box helicase n=1 Tax=Nocardioides palaemonis TaxID=2829810 RepID=UPI001BAC1D52|nr:type ISP restriction/modification enzyme [Nocardioides palaemonis]MBS2936579.1 DEAD/DEAH box helicase [Nocardioides palaemonis]
MGSTIYEVLDELRASAISESDKGSKFERLVKAYLRVDPVFADQFSDVWLWSEYPGRAGKPDTGIDLVAQDRITGDKVAIQCKFFAPTTVVSKQMIDSFLSASGKQSPGTAQPEFKERIVVSTTEKWGSNAEDAIRNQLVPVRRIGMSELESSRVDWSLFSLETPEVLPLQGKKTPRPHQRTAIDKVVAGFGETDRGKLIMACGTGKTFTSLRLAEENVGAGGRVLFLVPSISLLSQTVREWVGEADLPIRPLAVCSDAKSTKRSANADEDISTTDLALPATTDVAVLRKRLADAKADTSALTVVFATYQSIDVVAQAIDGERFDLIVSDEAHRTTGATLAGESESAFVRVHDDDYLRAKKRLYMTATPRIYDDTSRAKAGQSNVVLASMDDEETYGPEFHRLGFGEAVEADLLTDYKVLVLTVDEESVARTFQSQLSDGDHELDLDDAAKIVGCWNGLAKRGKAEHDFADDPEPMRRAVAFAGNIQASKRIEELFTDVTRYYVDQVNLEDESGASPLTCQVRHVDGTFNALERNTRIDWLQAESKPNHARILTNARCLSEGVDVPALDAVMFLSPRKSVVDIIQSVGRVMRKAPGKKFGYIILPVGVPSGMSPEEALRDNKRYAAVWEVLQALRAHDERFDAMVNRIDLTSDRDRKINVIGVGGDDRKDGGQGELQLAFGDLDAWRDAIYSRIVDKVGTRRYWQDWAKSVADIATRQTTRINALLADETSDVSKEFDVFLSGLRGNLNEGISRSDAIDMLAQHLITRPVFNALFEGSQFLDHNPVAKAMERMLAALDEHNVDDENHTLEKFYESVRMRVQGINTAEGRQKIIIELYDTFFATAFKKTVDKLGIVYTPVEIVDFILKSADDVLKQEFGQSLSDEGVHILDGFTGTGTFMVRLLQSGLIKPEDLARKYANELHANEILLLAYYIAAVNIETTYYDVMTQVAAPGRGKHAADPGHEYVEFPGLILTDTFQSWEDDDRQDLDVFPENNERLERLKQLPITVIVGNPPYSSRQESANDDNANRSYAGLDRAIRESFADRSRATNKNSLYDSYIRAIKWASLRIRGNGLVAFVTNSGFINSNTADGMRLALAEEFSTLYILNLRGSALGAGDARQKEGGGVFGAGSRAGVAVTLLIKRSDNLRGPAEIRYSEVGDRLTREQKLTWVSSLPPITQLDARVIAPNADGDWLDQRDHRFGSFLPIGDRSGASIFVDYAMGVATNRDTWVYNYGEKRLGAAMALANQTYAAALDGRRTNDSKKIKWSSSLEGSLERGRVLELSTDPPFRAVYRPFQASLLYADFAWIHRPRTVRDYFPVTGADNLGFYVTAPGATKPFSCLMTDAVPDLNFWGSEGGQFFGRWRYEEQQDDMLSLSEGDDLSANGDRRIDNISEVVEGQFRAAYGEFSKDEIFFYVYGLLHSPEYRETYAADLKKMLPRIPLVEEPWPFVEAGQKLSELHLGYETVTPYPLQGLDGEPVSTSSTSDARYDFFRVQKMAFAKVRDPETKKLVADKTRVVYNSHIELGGIPEAAYRYMLGSRSAVEWIIDRYQVKTDKASGIVNDPNDWSREVSDPRYIIDLLARIVTVSLETMKIVDNLPALAIREDQGN